MIILGLFGSLALKANERNQKSHVMQSVCGHISGGANVDTPLPPPPLPPQPPPTPTTPYHLPPLLQIMVLKEANS